MQVSSNLFMPDNLNHMINPSEQEGITQHQYRREGNTGSKLIKIAQ